eukprot:UN07327
MIDSLLFVVKVSFQTSSFQSTSFYFLLRFTHQNSNFLSG